MSCYEFASDNIRLIKILENIYYNQDCHLACKILKRFFLETTISGVDLLEMTLNGGIVALYPYHCQCFRILEDSQ